MEITMRMKCFNEKPLWLALEVQENLSKLLDLAVNYPELLNSTILDIKNEEVRELTILAFKEYASHMENKTYKKIGEVK